MKKTFLATLCLLQSVYGASQKEKLHILYHTHSLLKNCDINEHLPELRQLASECASAAEIGVRSMVSTWGILQGLADSANPETVYIGIDLDLPPQNTLKTAKELAESQGIAFHFWQGNDMLLALPPVDLLFIDSLHTYCHLTYELEKFSPLVGKYIALHDTGSSWGERDDLDYQGDSSEYDSWIDRSKRGLWLAVVDFLERHPEWVLHKHKTNSNGLTILKRMEEEQS